MMPLREPLVIDRGEAEEGPPLCWRCYHVRGLIWSFGVIVFSEVQGEWAAEAHFGPWVIGIERTCAEDD